MGRELGSRGAASGTNISPISEMGEMFVLKLKQNGKNESPKGKKKYGANEVCQKQGTPSRKIGGRFLRPGRHEGGAGFRLPRESVLTLGGYF